MDISFVILTWNSADHLSECLRSLFENVDESRFSYEVRIVDNGSVDNTQRIICEYEEKHPGRIVTVWLKRNIGTTRSRNMALKEVPGDFIIVLDSDVEVRQGTVETLIRVWDEFPSCGIAVPRLEYSDGSLQKSTDAFPTLLTKIFRFLFLKYREHRESLMKHDFLSAEIQKVDYAISAFWVFKRESLSEVGLLDENIFYAPEDVDFCLRMWESGRQILYVPQASATHHAREISRHINLSTLHHILGLMYFFVKHRYLFKRPQFGI